MVEAVLPRNQLSFLDKLRMFFVLLTTPPVLLWTTLTWPLSSYGREHGLKRLLADHAVRHLAGSMNRRQLRAFFGPTRGVYDAFMKEKKMPQIVEDVGEDAKLLWVGPKNTERVILYFHGGAFLLGAIGSSPALWWYMKSKLAKTGKDAGVAMLQYTLVPDRAFPAQLHQAVLAIQHVLNSGVQPENIQLCGDSAGGLLIHEVFSHILHPVEGVPKLEVSSPFGGAFMMSPWTRLRDPEEKYLKQHDSGSDMISFSSLAYWGPQILEGVPESAIPYLEANEAPANWLKGLNKCVKRMLITAGGVEVLRPEIIKYAATVERHLKDTKTVTQKNGVHVDPYLDFMVGVEDGDLTPVILNWLDEGFAVSS